MAFVLTTIVGKEGWKGQRSRWEDGSEQSRRFQETYHKKTWELSGLSRHFVHVHLPHLSPFHLALNVHSPILLSVCYLHIPSHSKNIPPLLSEQAHIWLSSKDFNMSNAIWRIFIESCLQHSWFKVDDLGHSLHSASFNSMALTAFYFPMVSTPI